MKKIAILACVAASLLSAPAYSQTVGVIDTQPTTIPANVKIDFINMGSEVNNLKQDSGRTHGQESLSAISKEYKASQPLHIYWSAPFDRNDVRNQTKNNALKMNWTMAIKTLHMMAANNVKLVCTTFVTNDRVNAQRFADTAAELGITIVASIGNGETMTPFPAMLGGNIVSVASNNTAGYLPGTEKLMKAAKFQVNGRSAFSSDSFSSSVAAAKKCGMMANN